MNCARGLSGLTNFRMCMPEDKYADLEGGNKRKTKRKD